MKRIKKEFKKTKTSLLAILLVFISTFLVSGGQLFIKLGLNEISSLSLTSILNILLILGLILYFFALILVLNSLKRGELSVLYPIIALDYIWVTILSSLFLNETLNLWKIFGVVTIFFGVVLIGIGGRK